jgi:hypothetical protein
MFGKNSEISFEGIISAFMSLGYADLFDCISLNAPNREVL